MWYYQFTRVRVTQWSEVYTDYRGIKLLEHAIEVIESVFEHRIRQQTEIECGPMPIVMAAQSPLRKFRNSVFSTTPQSLADGRCSSAVQSHCQYRERKTWMQSEFCSWQNSVRGQEPPKMYIYTVSQKTSHLYTLL